MANGTGKIYDLEERTYIFAKDVAMFCKTLPYNTITSEYVKQLVRSSASVGANYIEANESLSKKDFIMRIKICRKEAKETAYWLRLLTATSQQQFTDKISQLLDEAIQLKKIFASMIS